MDSSGDLVRFERPGPVAILIAKILATCFPDATNVSDLTPGCGNFWCSDVPINVTVSRSTADFRCLPYPDASSDVALLDAPHNADAPAASWASATVLTAQANLRRSSAQVSGGVASRAAR